MPLPAALLARLKKRGIIKQQDDADDPDEEIIAEEYDEDPSSTKLATFPAAPHQAKNPKSAGASSCPNKRNPYHKCTSYCWERWGGGIAMDKLDADMEHRRKRMLRKYPLPSGWEEVFSPDHGRYYYWNTYNDDVCWLSPTHPKAVITKSASNLRISAAKSATKKRARSLSPVQRREKDQRESEDEEGFSDEESDEEDISGEEEEDKSEEESGSEREHGKHSRGDERYRSRDNYGRQRQQINDWRVSKKKKDNELDPMDPASYSDVAPGKWSAGLETGDDAKTGVDSTASGPLFQMRPYPAPGAIMRRNAEASKHKKKK